MKRILHTLPLTLLLFALLFVSVCPAGSQTLTITPTSVEVISAGAKTRAFYGIDDVFFSNTSAGGFTVKDAASGTILFSGDTSEVTITGLTLWSDKQAFLKLICNQIPYDASSYPLTYIPKRGLNFLYKNAAGTVTAMHSRSKYPVWTGTYPTFSDSSNATNALAWIRNRLFADAQRAYTDIGPAPTIAADTSAGTSPTITIAGAGASGEITLTSGSSTKTTGVIAKITLPVSYDVMFVALTASNVNAGAHIARVFVQQEDDDTFSLRATGTAISASTAYKWQYRVSGYNTTPN